MTTKSVMVIFGCSLPVSLDCEFEVVVVHCISAAPFVAWVPMICQLDIVRNRTLTLIEREDDTRS
jgi:hypothetical protein